MSNAYKVLTRQEKSALLAEVGIEKVFDLCRELRPKNQCTRAGNQIKARCMFPGHADNNPSMGIVFEDKRVYMKCFSCGQYESDGLKIVSHIAGVYDTSRVYSEIFGQTFNVKLDPDYDDALAQEDFLSHFKQALLTAGNHLLLSASANLGKEFSYAQPAVAYLQKRGFPASSFTRLGIGVFPTLGHFGAHADRHAMITAKEYLADYVFEAKPQAIGNYGGWLMFPYYTTPTTIGRIKLRNPQDKTQEIWLGNHKSEPRGFFGLNRCAEILGQNTREARDAYLVEGEFDQLALMQAQEARNPNKQYVLLAGSGSGVSDLDMLANSGIQRVVLIGDNDKGGQQFISQTLNKASQKRVLDFKVYDWKSLAKYNDPDDVVQGGDFNTFMDGLTKHDNVVDLHEWSARRAQEDLSSVHAPSTVKKLEILNKNGRHIKHKGERDLYIDIVAQRTGLNASILAKHLVDEDSPHAFLLNIESELHRVIEPVANDGPSRAMFYCRRTGEIFTVSLDKAREVQTAFQTQVFGMHVYDYLSATIGIPNNIRMTSGKRPVERPLVQQARETVDQFYWAVQSVSATSKPLTKFQIRRQGIHWADAELEELDAALLTPDEPSQRVLVVNAHKRYIGVPRDDGLLVYKELESPVHGGNLLLGTDQPWTRVLETVHDLNAPPTMSRKELYSNLLTFYDAWRFVDHELIRHFLAAYTLALSHIDLFEHLPHVLFTAPSQSGKSTLVKGVLRGEDPVHIGLIDHSIGSDDYTAAGIMQTAQETTLLQCLEEMESPDDHTRNDAKPQAVAEFLACIRNVNGRKGMRRVRGGRTGTPTTAYHRFAATGSAVHPLKEEVDRNRWFTLELKKEPGRTRPEDYLRQKFGKEKIAEMRRNILQHSLQQGYRDYLREQELVREIFDGKAFEVTETRGLSSLLPLLTIMKDVGMDYLGWGASFMQWHSDMLAAANTSAERTMFEAVFETNAIMIPNEPVPRSVISILADPDLRTQLSHADCGVYHLPGTAYCVLYPKKLTSILRHHANYRFMTNTSQIHTLLRRNAQVDYNPNYFRGNHKLEMHLRAYISQPNPEDLLLVRFEHLGFDAPHVGDIPDPQDVL